MDYESSSQGFDEYHEIDCQLVSKMRHTGFAFFQSFGRFTQIQREAIPIILSGQDALLVSATASGKTEAACAPLVERLFSETKPWTILYISPTRALINDLYVRLQKPAQQLNLRINRRTGDHRDTLRHIPHILITTPESFDSMLCRNRRNDKYGHDLAHVRAVILDEIHLLHGTTRGEQLVWLLKRLKKLRNYAQSKGWTRSSDFQTVALSATIPDSNAVMKKYFSHEASLVEIRQKRPIELVRSPSETIDTESSVCQYIYSLDIPEKILIFSNTRKRVDILSQKLKNELFGTGYEIYAHHGSLSKSEREEAEWAVNNKNRVVMVATSTLEIGIDIGNIDLVVLDGPPPDVSSLLQRIGRGNRRTDKTRVMICAEKLSDLILQHAMIDAAAEGWLGEETSGPYYSVFRQQTASYIFQSPNKKRRIESLCSLFSGSSLETTIYNSILRTMIEEGELIEAENKTVKLGEYWWNLSEKRGMIHSNIEGSPGNRVIDIDTGREVAHGVRYPGGKGTIGIGGKTLEVFKWDKLRIEVRDVIHGGMTSKEWCYDSRPMFLSSSQPQALKKYLNISNIVWPLIQKDGYTYIFHFGGAIRSAVLTLIEKQYGCPMISEINGWYLKYKGYLDEKQREYCIFTPEILKNILMTDETILNSLEMRLNCPNASKALPFSVRVEEVWGWLNIKKEAEIIKNSRWEPLPNSDDQSILEHFTDAI